VGKPAFMEAWVGFLLRFVPSVETDGFRIYCPPAVAAPILKGLNLLSGLDARRYRRARQYAPIIIGAGPTLFSTRTHRSYISVKDLENEVDAARVVVRMATYGYFIRQRHVSYSGPWRSGLEQICGREELRFLWKVTEATLADDVARSSYMSKWVEYQLAVMDGFRLREYGIERPDRRQTPGEGAGGPRWTIRSAQDAVAAFNGAFDRWQGRM
jgi:hypothetical protein